MDALKNEMICEDVALVKPATLEEGGRACLKTWKREKEERQNGWIKGLLKLWEKESCEEED